MHFSYKKAISLTIAGTMLYEVVALPLAEAKQVSMLWMERQSHISQPQITPKIQSPLSHTHSLKKISEKEEFIPGE